MKLPPKLRLTGLILAGVLLLGFLGILLLEAPPAKRYALQKVRQILAGRGIDFSAASLDYNLFTLSASLNGVVIRAAATPGLPPVLKVSRIQVKAGLWQLFRGVVLIEDAAVTNPEIHLVTDARGRQNIPEISGGGGGGGPQVFLQTLRVTGGSLVVDSQPEKAVLRLPIWRLGVDGDLASAKYQLRFQTGGSGEVTFEGRTLQLDALSVEAQMAGDTIELREFRLSTAQSKFDLAGTIHDLAAPVLDLKLVSNLALPPLLQFAGVRQDVMGALSIHATASGPVSQLKVATTIASKNIGVERIAPINLYVEALCDLGSQRLEVTELTARSPVGSVKGDAGVALAAKGGTSTVSADVTNIDLWRIGRALALPIQVASRATGSVHARWQGIAYRSADAEANLRLDSARERPTKDVLPISGSLSAVSRAGRVTVSVASLNSIASHAEGNITLEDFQKIGGRVRVGAQNLAATFARLDDFLGKRVTDLAIAGPMGATATLGGTLDRPEIAVNVQAPGLEVGDLRDVSLDADVAYDPNRIDVRSVAVRWQQQAITAKGTVGLQGKSPKLDLAARIEQAAIHSALVGLGQPETPVRGILSAALDVTGTVDNPHAVMSLSAANLEAYGEPLGKLEAEARFENNVVNLTNLRLDKPADGGHLHATGLYALPDKTYTVEIDSPRLKLTHLTLPNDLPVRAEIGLSAKGSGTVEDPKLALKLSLADVQVGEEAVGAIDADLDVGGGQARMELRAPRYNLAADGQAGIRDPYPTQFAVKANGTNLALFPFQPKLDGTVTISLQGSGNLTDWRSGQVVLQIPELNASWKDQPIRTDGPLEIAYANGVLKAHQATLLVGDSRVSLDGSLPLRNDMPPGALKLLASADLAGLAPLLPEQLPVEARGQFTLDATVRGSVERLDPTASLTLKDGSIQSAEIGPPISNLTMAVQLQNGVVKVDQLSANWASATIEAGGEMPLAILPRTLPIQMHPSKEPAQFSFDVKGLQLASIQGLSKKIGGTVSLHIDARAAKPELQALNVRATFPQLELSLAGSELRPQSPVLITLQNEVVRIDQFQLTGPEARFNLAGTAGVSGKRPIDLTLDANLNASLLAGFVTGIQATGKTRVNLAMKGNMQSPQVTGFLELAGGQIGVRTPGLQVDDLNARLDFAGDRLTITQFKGLLNGGTLAGSGGARYSSGRVTDADVKLSADDVYLSFPSGLKTMSSTSLALQSRGQDLVLGGNVHILEGSYTDPLNLDSLLGSALSGSEVETVEQQNPTLSRIRYNINVDTQSPLVVDNNLAKLGLTMDLQVVGSYYRPGVTGRINIAEGGELYLSEKTYLVDRGVITLVNAQRIEPDLNIQARTKASRYDITLRISGNPEKLETTLTSDPPLPEPDIVALLVTGRTLEEVRGSELEVAKEQVLSYLTGRLGGALSQQAQRTLGLSQVRIEPNLISGESDPNARLTVGQDITRDLSLVYSTNLIDSSDQIWITQYDISRNFSTRAIRQSDNSYRFDFNREKQFGGMPSEQASASSQIRKIGRITFTGNSRFPSEELLRRFKVKPGSRYDFFKLRKGIDRLESFYAKQGLLEARIYMERSEHDGTVDLTLNVHAGPEVRFVYEGWNPSGGVKKKVRKHWQNGVFEGQRASDSMDAIKTALIKDGYTQSTVKYSLTSPSAGNRRVLFDIQPGVRYRNVRFVFEGAKGVAPDRLKDILGKNDLKTRIYITPEDVTDRLDRYYRQNGYLDAEVKAPRYEWDTPNHTGKIIIPIQEGPLFHVGKIEFNGNQALTDTDLRNSLQLRTGQTYRSELRQDTFAKLQNLYWQKGYRDVDITYSLAKDSKAGSVNLLFHITENKQYIVQDVQVAGTDQTSQSLVRGQVAMKPGEVLNNEELTRARRNLYNTGAYSVVDLQPQPLGAGGTNLEPGQLPVSLGVKVREIKPFSLQYGGFYDTERGPGGIADFSNRNTLGAARVLGIRMRYDGDVHEGRLYFSQPLLRRFPLKTDAVGFARREFHPTFIADRIGFSLQQETQFRENYVLTYGYRLADTHTFDREPDPLFPFDVTLRVAPLTSSLTRETRDDQLNSTRGSFFSQAFEYGPGWLGSQLNYLKYYSQYFKYVPLSKPEEIPFSKGLRKPRWIYAGGVRLGLAGGLHGQNLVQSERFFAGGGTTIRGFSQDGVGPKDFVGDPVGGNAVFVLNNEIRFPIYSIFGGVGFVDIGNVYPSVTDFNPFDVRKSAGVGLRVRTPYVLLRLDYGIKLDRKPGEGFGKLFFSIGQAF